MCSIREILMASLEYVGSKASEGRRLNDVLLYGVFGHL